MDPHASKAHGQADLPPAADKPPVFGLFILMIATTVFVVGSGLAVKTLLAIRAGAEIQAKTVLDQGLAANRATSKESLEKYDAIDPAKGVYQIPVARSMEMMVRDPSLIAPLVEAPPQAAMPSPAPAAEAPAADTTAPATAPEGASPAGAP